MQKSSAALAQVFDEAGRQPSSNPANGHITSSSFEPERRSRPAPSHKQQAGFCSVLSHCSLKR